MPVSTGSTTGSTATSGGGTKSSGSSTGGGGKTNGSATGPGGMFGGGGGGGGGGGKGGNASSTAGGTKTGSSSGKSSTSSGSIGSKGGGASTQAPGSGTGGAKAGTVSKSGLAAASGANAANSAMSTRGISSAKTAAKGTGTASKSPSTSKGSATGPGGMFGGAPTKAAPSAKVSDPSRGTVSKPTGGSGIVGSKGGGASTQKPGAGVGGAKAGPVSKAGLAAAEGSNIAQRQQTVKGITSAKTAAERARESFTQTYGPKVLGGSVLTGTPRNVPISPAKDSPRVAGSATGPGGMFGGAPTSRAPGAPGLGAFAGTPANPQRSTAGKSDYGGIDTGNQVSGIKSNYGGIDTGRQITGNKTNIGGTVNGSATDTAWAGGPANPQKSNVAGKTDKNASPKVANPSGTDSFWGGPNTTPQESNTAEKTDRTRQPTNADLAREIGNMYDAAKNGITNSVKNIASVFTGPPQQEVNRAEKTGLPSNRFGNQTVTGSLFGMQPTSPSLGQVVGGLPIGFTGPRVGTAQSSLGDITHTDPVGEMATLSGLGDKAAQGTLLGEYAPAKSITDRVGPSVPTRGLPAAPGAPGMPAPTGEESVTPSVPTRMDGIGYGFPSFDPASDIQQRAIDRGLIGSVVGQSALDQQRQDAFNKIAAARGQVVPMGGPPPGAPAPGAPTMVNPLAGMVTFSNLANPESLAAGRLLGRGDLTAPGLTGYGNIGGVPVGGLGNRGVPTAPSPGQSINPSQEGDMVAPSQEYDGPPNKNPSQDDGQMKSLRDVYNRYQYEKQRVKEGVRSLPGRIGEAIRTGDFRGLPFSGDPRSNNNEGMPGRGVPAQAGSQDQLLSQILAMLLQQQQQQSQGIASPSQMDLVYRTFI